MHKTLSDPLTLFFSVLALAGVVSHVTQLDNITSLVTSKPNSNYSEHVVSRMVEAPKDIHIDLLAFSGDTYNMRTEPPTARPRESDENDQTNNKSIAIGDESGDVYAQSTT
jgi:hypothetical protein